jgi:ABC-type Zn uptake system ZnuABC Zn-binding protein ZnuA
VQADGGFVQNVTDTHQARSNAGGQAQVVYLADGIDLLDVSTDQHTDENGHHNEADPHVWTDPNNVLVWVASIQNTLGELDPDNAAIYQANADQYGQELQQLDAWIREQVAQIPTEIREIITDHLVFGYFADEYGFTQVGAILPGYSTLAEPSAQELAQTEDAIRDLGVKALFVGETVNSQVAKQVALDTGLQLVFLNTGSLSEEGGQADSYLDYIRYNVEAIVNALK